MEIVMMMMSLRGRGAKMIWRSRRRMRIWMRRAWRMRRGRRRWKACLDLFRIQEAVSALPC